MNGNDWRADLGRELVRDLAAKLTSERALVTVLVLALVGLDQWLEWAISRDGWAVITVACVAFMASKTVRPSGGRAPSPPGAASIPDPAAAELAELEVEEQRAAEEAAARQRRRAALKGIENDQTDDSPR